jgi:hypothetical protein
MDDATFGPAILVRCMIDKEMIFHYLAHVGEYFVCAIGTRSGELRNSFSTVVRLVSKTHRYKPLHCQQKHNPVDCLFLYIDVSATHQMTSESEIIWLIGRIEQPKDLFKLGWVQSLVGRV